MASTTKGGLNFVSSCSRQVLKIMKVDSGAFAQPEIIGRRTNMNLCISRHLDVLIASQNLLIGQCIMGFELLSLKGSDNYRPEIFMCTCDEVR